MAVNIGLLEKLRQRLGGHRAGSEYVMTVGAKAEAGGHRAGSEYVMTGGAKAEAVGT